MEAGEEKPEDPEEPPIEAVTGDSAEDGDPEDVPPIQVDFAALREMNPDIVGWLYIGALDISYPVVQGTDNEYYLHRTFEGKDNFAGLFLWSARTAATGRTAIPLCTATT